MRYFFSSVRTLSFWRYALFSVEALTATLAIVGGVWLFMELLDFLQIYTKDHYSKLAIFPILLLAVAIVVFTRRPVGRISYKPPGKDYRIDVKIGDLLAEPEDVVISSNTTFDTDMSSGLISAQSLQGQFATQYFNGNTGEIDRQLAERLRGVPHTRREDAPGKKDEYPIGTVAMVETHGRNFYFVAMSRLSEHGTAQSSIREVEQALETLWRFIGERGELREVAVPLMGTGRGRITVPRKKMAERIAQSYADAQREKRLANRLTIVVHPPDAENFGINLFEIKDYLTRSLHT